MLIGTVIIVALAILIGALFLHMSYLYGSMKGYEKGLDDAETIFIETRRKSVGEFGKKYRQSEGYEDVFGDENRA